MGAWGKSPFSSDDFGDMFDEAAAVLEKPVIALLDKMKKRVRGRYASSEKWSWVGLVIWAGNIGGVGGAELQPHAYAAQEFIAELKADKEWMSSWRGGGMPAVLKQAHEMLDEIILDRPPILPNGLAELFPKR